MKKHPGLKLDNKTKEKIFNIIIATIFFVLGCIYTNYTNSINEKMRKIEKQTDEEAKKMELAASMTGVINELEDNNSCLKDIIEKTKYITFQKNDIDTVTTDILSKDCVKVVSISNSGDINKFALIFDGAKYLLDRLSNYNILYQNFLSMHNIYLNRISSYKLSLDLNDIENKNMIGSLMKLNEAATNLYNYGTETNNYLIKNNYATITTISPNKREIKLHY